MKKAMVIGLGVMLLAAACGGASDSAEQATTTMAVPTETSVGSTASPEVSGDAAAVSGTTPPTTSSGEPDLVESSPAPTSGEAGEDTPAQDQGEAVEPTPIEHPNPQVVTAMTDLIGRLGVSASAVEVVSIEEVTWPDGSIGCPQPDMSYTQALVNGSRIVLRVDGAEYQYNSGGRREPFYCKNPSDPVPGGGDYGDN
jgi:hypothetical protein